MSGLDRMFAKVVLASQSALTPALPLVTMHLHYPDIIHGEVMTHRVFSRNARSMRAVPVKKMAQEVIDDPFVPWHWGKNQRGMQASEECNELVAVRNFNLDHDEENTSGRKHDLVSREEAWLDEAKHAAEKALAYDAAGYHKQVANRIIAPYTWKHTLITSTSWANFLHLRDHEDAEPHFHDLAAMVREALRTARFWKLSPGEWHLPYVTQEEIKNLPLEVCQKLSAARSARVSYAPFDGDASVEREIQRFNHLIESQPLHASPTEHQATPDTGAPMAIEPNKWIYDNAHMSGNFAPGWIQFRKTLPGEYIEDVAA
jgi:hypothetical protein